MFGKESVKCAKCGITSKENSSLIFHRFPLPSIHGSLKARVWATFCFPNDDWTSNTSLEKLYKQHKMLCGSHFDDSSYTSSDRKRLNKFAIPTDARNLLAQLRDEQCYPVNPPIEVHDIQMLRIPFHSPAVHQCLLLVPRDLYSLLLPDLCSLPVRRGFHNLAILQDLRLDREQKSDDAVKVDDHRHLQAGYKKKGTASLKLRPREWRLSFYRHKTRQQWQLLFIDWTLCP